MVCSDLFYISVIYLFFVHGSSQDLIAVMRCFLDGFIKYEVNIYVEIM